MKTENQESSFGTVIYTYTRSQAVADSYQIELTKTAKEAGISFPVFVTRSAFDAYVAVPVGVEGQDEAGRLWDVVWMLRYAIMRCISGHWLASCIRGPTPPLKGTPAVAGRKTVSITLSNEANDLL